MYSYFLSTALPDQKFYLILVSQHMKVTEYAKS